MPETYDQIICSLSGLLPTDEEMASVDPTDEDEESAIPVGWTQIACRKRVLNPEWINLQMAKGAIVDATVQATAQQFSAAGQSVPDLSATRQVAELQVAAQFFAMEQSIPEYVVQEHVFWMAPASRDPELAGAIMDFYAQMSTDTVGISDEEDFNEPDDTDDPSVETGDPTSGGEDTDDE